MEKNCHFGVAGQELWDWRRLIVPTKLFLEKIFQNWSKVQDTNLIGAVYLYADFCFPVKEVRNNLEFILQNTPYWDKNVGELQVSDLKEQVMQIKILVSTPNENSLSTLKAYIREEIIAYIVQNHPYALPKSRTYQQKQDFDCAAGVEKK